MLDLHIPEWFELVEQTDSYLDGTARLSGTIWKQDGISLRIWFDKVPRASETVPGTALPAVCLERHILSRGMFCLSLHGRPVTNKGAADLWWDQLAQFIQCQSTASETGIWPPQHALDHGHAGTWHAQALVLAEALGLEDEYFAVHSGLQSEFLDSTIRRHRSKPRFQALLNIESKRRAALAQFTKRYSCNGEKCCGSMRDCLLPKQRNRPLMLPRHMNKAERKGALMATTAVACALAGGLMPQRYAS